MALDDIFTLDIETIDVEIGEAVFKVKHLDMNDVEYQKVLQRVSKPYRQAAQRNELDPKILRKLQITTFVKTTLVGWHNVIRKEGDAAIPYSEEAAVALFTDLPKLFNAVMVEAQDMSRFRTADLEALAKN